jgi:hypothetical protein
VSDTTVRRAAGASPAGNPQWRFPTPLRDLVRRLAAVLCPPDVERFGIVPFVVDEAERGLAESPSHIRTLVLAGLWAFALSARLAALRGERLPEHFERWWSSSATLKRAVAKSMKALVVLPYYEHPSVMTSMGYDPASWMQARARHRLATYAADIERHRSLLLRPDPLVAIGEAHRDAPG